MKVRYILSSSLWFSSSILEFLQYKSNLPQKTEILCIKKAVFLYHFLSISIFPPAFEHAPISDVIITLIRIFYSNNFPNKIYIIFNFILQLDLTAISVIWVLYFISQILSASLTFLYSFLQIRLHRVFDFYYILN